MALFFANAATLPPPSVYFMCVYLLEELVKGMIFKSIFLKRCFKLSEKLVIIYYADSSTSCTLFCVVV